MTRSRVVSGTRRRYGYASGNLGLRWTSGTPLFHFFAEASWLPGLLLQQGDPALFGAYHASVGCGSDWGELGVRFTDVHPQVGSTEQTFSFFVGFTGGPTRRIEEPAPTE